MAQKQQGMGQGQNMNSGDMNRSQQIGTGSDRMDQAQQSDKNRTGKQQGADQQRGKQQSQGMDGQRGKQQSQQSVGGDTNYGSDRPRDQEIRDVNRSGPDQTR